VKEATGLPGSENWSTWTEAGTWALVGWLLWTAKSSGVGGLAAKLTPATASAPTWSSELWLRLSEVGGVAPDGGGGAVTVQPDSLAAVALADPSLTSTVQSAGAQNGCRSSLKLPAPSLVAIATPSTVIVRLAIARPSSLSLVPLSSARLMLTVAMAVEVMTASPARATMTATAAVRP
jgi:hypothetical protein